MVKTSLCKAGGAGLIPGRGAKIPHASRPKDRNIKQKQYCNKFNKDFKNGPHQKKISFLKKRPWKIIFLICKRLLIKILTILFTFSFNSYRRRWPLQQGMLSPYILGLPLWSQPPEASWLWLCLYLSILPPIVWPPLFQAVKSEQ